ncbi:MAG: hypothetical protein Q7K57_24975 [Burkholderiaceae bacterium]|nr:hypothetical protein [Burkholderiaceae bacterium]
MEKPIKTPKASLRPGENGFTYRQQYGLVITARDEAHQRSLYNKLTKQGLKVKVVCV